MSKSALGSLFDKAVKSACPGGITAEFYLGFVTGHAEKVWLGVAPASLFRPPVGNQDLVHHVVADICEIYGLRFTAIDTQRGIEFWIFRDKWVHDRLKELQTFQEDTALWHSVRGALCGIPTNEIDHDYHERYEDAKRE